MAHFSSHGLRVKKHILQAFKQTNYNQWQFVVNTWFIRIEVPVCNHLRDSPQENKHSLIIYSIHSHVVAKMLNAEEDSLNNAGNQKVSFPIVFCYIFYIRTSRCFLFLLFSIIYSISQKWVHPSYFCKYLIISFHMTRLNKLHFSTM